MKWQSSIITAIVLMSGCVTGEAFSQLAEQQYFAQQQYSAQQYPDLAGANLNSGQVFIDPAYTGQNSSTPLFGDTAALGDSWKLFDGSGSFNIGGWLQTGYHTENTGLFNQRPREVQLQQGWLYADKAANGSQGLDWGFRVDLVYGTDAADTQAFGNNAGIWDFDNGFDRGGPTGYGWAIPQAYIEVAEGDWSIIAGHFYTLAGYEVVTAPDNFFYSHSYTMVNSEPFTHTGVLGTWTVSDSIEFYGGWTAGWDTGFDQFGDGSTFLGGASLSLTNSTSLTYITSFGDLGRRNAGNNSYGHSIVLDTAVTENLNWVLQSDYLDAGENDTSWGLNNYLIYTASENVGYGLRTEWWRANNVSFYEVTAGINYRVHSNLIFRPEIRQDWSPRLDTSETSLAIDAILTF